MKKRKREERLTEHKQDYGEDKETEHGPNVTLAHKQIYELCDGIPERYDAEAGKRDGHDEDERVPPGGRCADRGQTPGRPKTRISVRCRQCCKKKKKAAESTGSGSRMHTVGDEH